MLTRRTFLKNTGKGLAFSFFDHRFFSEMGDDNQIPSLNAVFTGYKTGEQEYCVDSLLIGVGTKTAILRNFIKEWKALHTSDWHEPGLSNCEDTLEEYFISKYRGVEDIVDRYLKNKIAEYSGFPPRDEEGLKKIEKKLILIMFQMDSVAERKRALEIAQYAKRIGFEAVVGISNAYMDLKVNPDDRQLEKHEKYFDTIIAPSNHLYKASPNDFLFKIPPVDDSFYLHALKGILGMTIPGCIAHDMVDLLASLEYIGKVCFMGTGTGSGRGRMIKAASSALANLKIDELPSKMENVILLMEGMAEGPGQIHISESGDCLDYIEKVRMNPVWSLCGLIVTAQHKGEGEVRVTLFINGAEPRMDTYTDAP